MPCAKTVFTGPSRQRFTSQSPKPKIETSQDVDTTVSLVSFEKVDLENLDDQIKTMFKKSEARSMNGQGSMATCNLCGKEAPLKAMPRHIEAKHITGVSHPCDICGKISRFINDFRVYNLCHKKTWWKF